MKRGSGWQVRRVYDPPEPGDGRRVLVDRLWPRGVSKERAAVDEWLKDATPSNGLRSALHAGELDFAEFRDRYRAELAEPGPAQAVERLLEMARAGTVTLVTAVQDPGRSHVPVLVELLEQRQG
ncbi:DUF488 family protein [Streptomyces sp. NBC_00237]|uniref:DUF488 domain-containing protein n=1 Tax=Streptomyces sp. NBC_00237 TaxID=2975687 RepID=UPI002253CF92|nr:DUF488 family protein [Streptomyces sp. NBC_00237]MCX5205124.1 DUF488 family protein [Streptomyces sp. NBC_00237]